MINGAQLNGLFQSENQQGCEMQDLDRAAFDRYIETQLVPTLRPGDIVILDNLSVHKSARAKAAIRACGAQGLFLPQYSPPLLRWTAPLLRHQCAKNAL